MTKVLILGANGQLARNTARVFLKNTEAHLTRLSQPAMRTDGKGRGIKAGRSKVSTTWRVAGAEPPEQER
jgi:hypothetical protein